MISGAAAVAIAATTRRGVAALAATAGVDGSREPLDDAVAGEHAAVDGEVPADHKGTHGGVFLRQDIGLVCKVRLVLTPVYKDKASEAIGVSVQLVGGIRPTSTSAKT